MKTIVIVSGNTKSTFYFLSSLSYSNPPKNISPSVSRGWHGIGPALGRPQVLEASGLQEPGARRGGGPGAMGAHASHQPATAACIAGGTYRTLSSSQQTYELENSQ